MRFPLSRRGVVVVGLVLLGLFLVRPQVGGLRGRIAASLSEALGKRVKIGSVHLQILPRLGFQLDDVVVHDDPAFGAEPLLRSPDITASLRLSSLLRGRLEFSRLSLDDASLNLTRDIRGEWNVQSLLERARSSPTAPTASKQWRPEFPYIEADRARINLKIGLEKTHFALTDSEFSLWQEADDTWGLRLRARPIRTDANLTDTGLLRVNGTWRRASSLATTPVKFDFEWRQAQVGQLSKLVYGTDKGWRGDFVVSGSLAGMPGRLRVVADGTVDDFRRFDVLGGGNLRLGAHCSAEYNSPHRTLSNIECAAPVSEGSLELKGRLSAAAVPEYAFSLTASNVPPQSVMQLASHGDRRIPGGLATEGNILGTVTITRDAHMPAPVIEGNGMITDFGLAFGGQSVIAIAKVPLTIARERHSSVVLPGTEPFSVELGPVAVGLGKPAPLLTQVVFSRTGYKLTVHGDAGVKRLLQAARSIGLASPAFAAEGSSTVNLMVAGNWSSGKPARALGSVELHGVTARVRGVNAPLQIGKAGVLLTEDSVRVQNLRGSAAGATWHGSMQIPRTCDAADDCSIQFNLSADRLSAAGLNEYLNPNARKRSWYKMFTSAGEPVPYLLQARATGKLAIERLRLGTVLCERFAGDVDLRGGKLAVSNIRGDVLGGTAGGSLNADFAAKVPLYSGHGSLDSVSLSQVADLMHDGWIEGTGNSDFQFKAAGATIQDAIASADLQADFTVQDGIFPHILLTAGSTPLRADDFSGTLLLRKGGISLEDAKLINSSGVSSVSGTASLDGNLDFKLAAENASSYAITGTLVKTRVAPVKTPATQAALKP